MVGTNEYFASQICIDFFQNLSALHVLPNERAGPIQVSRRILRCVLRCGPPCSLTLEKSHSTSPSRAYKVELLGWKGGAGGGGLTQYATYMLLFGFIVYLLIQNKFFG